MAVWRGPAGFGRSRGVRNLLTGGFHGPVYPVNPTPPHVASVPAYDSVLDIPDDIHLAVIAVPASAVPDVIAQCAQKRVRGAIVLSTGFADAGPEGAATQRAMVELARRHGMRIIGPASLGVINTDPTAPLHASFACRGTCRPATSRCRCSRDRSVPA